MGRGRATSLGERGGGGHLTDRESLRKLFHLAAGLPVFTLRYLDWPSVLALTCGLLLFNLLLWPRLGGRLVWRTRELRRGRAAAIVAYPAVLVLAAFLFRHELGLVAALWALLAFGDGAAGWIGPRHPLRPLPWNRAKSWGGSISFWVVGWAGSAVALWWTSPGLGSWADLLVATGMGSAVSAAVESLPGSLDDNWTAPLAGVGVIALVLATGRPELYLGWLAAGAVLAWIAVRHGWLSADGGIAAAVVAGGIGGGLGGRGSVVLMLFFFAGVAASRPGAPSGRAGDQVLANGAVAALAGLLYAAGNGEALRLAALAALTEAVVDTVSGEIGQRFGAPARLITNGRRVPAGTDGAVSWPGTAVGVATACLFGLVSQGLELATPAESVVVAVAGLLGSGLDSLLGATLERSGWLDNQAVNLISTAVAALVAASWTTL